MGNTTPSRSKRTQRDYNLAFKLSLVNRVEKGEFTYKQAQSLYGIQGKSTVLTWLRKHGTLDWSSQRGPVMKTSSETPEQKIKRLEQRIKDLEDMHYIEGEMLKEVDRQCGTDFRKKYLSSVPARLKHLAK